MIHNQTQTHEEVTQSSSLAPIRTLAVVFDIPVVLGQVSRFRGAMAEHAGFEEDIFHNHYGVGDHRVKYRYPLVQYRSVGGKASLFGIGRGCEAIQDLLLRTDGKLRMGGKEYRMRMVELKTNETGLRVTNRLREYRVRDWLALNGENFKQWDALDSFTEKGWELERILGSQLIGFAKGVDWRVPERLEVRLQQIRGTRKVSYHGNSFVGFDVVFSLNGVIPLGIGLGKAVSHGFGVVGSHKSEVLSPKS